MCMKEIAKFSFRAQKTKSKVNLKLNLQFLYFISYSVAAPPCFCFNLTNRGKEFTKTMSYNSPMSVLISLEKCLTSKLFKYIIFLLCKTTYKEFLWCLINFLEIWQLILFNSDLSQSPQIWNNFWTFHLGQRTASWPSRPATSEPWL